MNTNQPVPPSLVKADPAKPYKAIIGAVVTFVGLLWASLEGKDNLDNMTAMEWAALLIPVILTFASVYGVTNPKIVDPPPAGGGAIPVRDDLGAGEGRLVLIIAGGILLALIVWLVLVPLLR